MSTLLHAGDIVAKTLREKIVAVIVMLIGASVFGYFMVRRLGTVALSEGACEG
jgi:hypothetical protein